MTLEKASCSFLLLHPCLYAGCTMSDFLGLSWLQLSLPSALRALCPPGSLPTEMTSGQGNARLKAGFD
jgi:hypothetical protein